VTAVELAEIAGSETEAPVTTGVRSWRLPGHGRLAEVGLDLAEPAVDEREESLEAAAGEFGQRDFWPLAVQDILTVKARYRQGVQVCGQALASRLTVIRRRTAHLNDPDLKGGPLPCESA
jgi:hypothetical protein